LEKTIGEESLASLWRLSPVLTYP